MIIDNATKSCEAPRLIFLFSYSLLDDMFPSQCSQTIFHKTSGVYLDKESTNAKWSWLGIHWIGFKADSAGLSSNN